MVVGKFLITLVCGHERGAFARYRKGGFYCIECKIEREQDPDIPARRK